MKIIHRIVLQPWQYALRQMWGAHGSKNCFRIQCPGNHLWMIGFLVTMRIIIMTTIMTQILMKIPFELVCIFSFPLLISPSMWVGNNSYRDSVEDDSPYPEVRAAVANTDDPDMPANTIRAWTLGIISAIIIPGVNQFMYFRYPTVAVGSVSEWLFIQWSDS